MTEKGASISRHCTPCFNIVQPKKHFGAEDELLARTEKGRTTNTQSLDRNT